jgi:TM2 domain-containing membrane protein YozV
MEEFGTTPPVNLPTLSDKRIWKGPDRNYFTFVVLSVILGFFGADHIYLRSFPTAIAKTFVNFLTLGLWYVWDILQIVDDGARIQKEGLNTPFDWVRGIGKGVFAPPSDTPPVIVAKKEYVFYAFLALCFGWVGADKFYMGEYAQGIVKLISCFNIFLFLFGWFWVAWDAYHAVFRMGDVLTDGITTPLPYSFIFKR